MNSTCPRTVQNDCFGCKGRQSRRKGTGSATGTERHTYMEHFQSGGRVQRHNLDGLTVLLNALPKRHSHTAPWYRATFNCKRDRATSEVAYCYPIVRLGDTSFRQCALRPSPRPKHSMLQVFPRHFRVRRSHGRSQYVQMIDHTAAPSI